MHRVLDGQGANPILVNLLWQLDRLRRCDDILKFLIENRLTGNNLHEGIVQNRWTPLGLAQAVIKRIDKDKIIRPILAHKDYRV